jgi:hypothetical protein
MAKTEPKWKAEVRDRVGKMSIDELLQFILDLAWTNEIEYGDNRTAYELTLIDEELKEKIQEMKDYVNRKNHKFPEDGTYFS